MVVVAAVVVVDCDNTLWRGVVGEIGPGLLALVGVTHSDGSEQARTLARKIHELRILRGEKSVADVATAAILVVSQFTLYGDARKGNRPAFVAAARPEVAQPLYERFCERTGARRGRFGAHMDVELVNDGPVTLLVDSRKHF